MSIIKSTSAGHDDDTVRRVELSTGAVVTVAQDCDSPARLYCMDCDDSVRVIIEVTVLSQEEWEPTEGSEPMCAKCWGTDLFRDEDAAEREGNLRMLEDHDEYVRLNVY